MATKFQPKPSKSAKKVVTCNYVNEIERAALNECTNSNTICIPNVDNIREEA